MYLNTNASAFHYINLSFYRPSNLAIDLSMYRYPPSYQYIWIYIGLSICRTIIPSIHSSISNLPKIPKYQSIAIPTYRLFDVSIYHSIDYAINLAMYRYPSIYLYLLVYKPINLSIYPLLNMPIYRSMNLQAHRPPILPTYQFATFVDLSHSANLSVQQSVELSIYRFIVRYRWYIIDWEDW